MDSRNKDNHDVNGLMLAMILIMLNKKDTVVDVIARSIAILPSSPWKKICYLHTHTVINGSILDLVLSKQSENPLGFPP